MLFRILISLLAFVEWNTAEIAYYDLNEYCSSNQAILLPCGADDLGRVGTMKFRTQPQQEECSVQIMIDTSTCSSPQSKKLYLNIKYLQTMPLDDSIDISEAYNHPVSNGTGIRVIRTLRRSLCSAKPSSCTYLLSKKLDPEQQTISLDYITSVILTYNRGNEVSSGGSPFTVDYTVVTGNRNGSNIFCSTTNGYVPKTEMCNDQDDRVVCPTNIPYQMVAQNAAGMQQGHSYHRECPSASTPSPPAREPLDDGAIAGIVVGIIVITAFVVLMALICRKRRVTTVVRNSRPQVTHVSGAITVIET